MKLELTLKQEYGNYRFYPENETAKVICKLAGCKSLHEGQIKLLKSIGFEVEVKLPASIASIVGGK